MVKLRKRVFVGMSGGVDSSVAALLLKEQEYDVTGVYLKCWSQERLDELGVLGECHSERDAEDARRVAEHIGIPFYVFDFEEEYKKRVVEYMVDGYRAGITPNPDVVCNREIKFGLFLEKALTLGADYVATGHYVRLRNTKNIRKYEKEIKPISYIRKKFVFRSLWQAKDTSKDQSYFLWTLTQEQLKHCLFPIGDYLKSEVREIARKAGLPTAEKKDSQGICFLGNVALADFLKQYLPEREGEVITVEGKKIGEHEGAHFYTIGQRHLGISNLKYPTSAKASAGRQKSKSDGNQKPHYVVEKDIATNTVVVAEGSDNPALFRKEVILANVNFINPNDYFLIRANKKAVTMKVLARVRYRQPLFEATLIYADGGWINADGNPHKSVSKSSSIRMVFKDPQKFVAPGQSAVFYLPAGASAKEGLPSDLSTKAQRVTAGALVKEGREGFEILGGGVIV
ncbi:tRNA 2-thiouridine(34) synthase MnmA [Candidatus Jorgensenbacteria bacterium CG10_big_fil_rev_8_21_14_0_10_54_38]|uniref:tRNA-specific 2-thiouridylase MnmA n=2 Tax=Candidatus Joergenseniibacteriota TaxID=1752739 RepID=A0A2M6WG22_9BACT|nr:MAG: tRNA 2-thiouridine(34) synthase MnmA [Candidatus Jorgensenbacteria bacterium CG23_combo_of_CG06-09_8_20_14_all_54_14]PIT91750.1 MAG: tRNA 2-thiouridine(34) synthase MnmA [Candidatus Jorgensenbacteria bacterium CG10_big_fil_rev_8_21_14_0_10_54_38]